MSPEIASRTVAVDDSLGAVKAALEAAGFPTVPLTDAARHRAAVVVVNGLEQNFLGREVSRAENPAPIINADGQTAQQVVAAVRERLQPRQAT